MAVPVPIPVIADLPPAPRRNDGPPDFVLKADAMIAALHPLVQQINIALQWISGQLTDTQASEKAAAVSAKAAAASVTEAVRQVELATEQAVLAGRERKGAEAALDSTEVVAAAVQSGAGFPALAGHAAHALRVKLDESGVEFSELGQEIGDVLITRRATTPAGYVRPGTVYAQAAYPELFALTGILEVNNDGANLARIGDLPDTLIYTNVLVIGKDDVVMVFGQGVGGMPMGVTHRSTDMGNTWTAVPFLTGKSPIRAASTDGYGNWVAHATQQEGSGFPVYTSTDNGVTWAKQAGVGLPNLTPAYALSGSQGKFVAGFNSAPTNFYVSEDSGVTWSARLSSAASYVVWLKGSSWLFTVSNSESQLSPDDFKSSFNIGIFPSIKSGGGSGVAVGFGALGVCVMAPDGKTVYAPQIPIKDLKVDREGCVYSFAERPVGAVSGYGSASVYKSYDGGVTWTNTPVLMLTDPSAAVVMASTGSWLSAHRSTRVTYRSTRLYNYDAATQFKTQHAKAPSGMYAYIKAKKV